MFIVKMSGYFFSVSVIWQRCGLCSYDCNSAIVLILGHREICIGDDLRQEFSSFKTCWATVTLVNRNRILFTRIRKWRIKYSLILKLKGLLIAFNFLNRQLPTRVRIPYFIDRLQLIELLVIFYEIWAPSIFSKEATFRLKYRWFVDCFVEKCSLVV